jgi:hypothetical protein
MGAATPIAFGISQFATAAVLRGRPSQFENHA